MKFLTVVAALLGVAAAAPSIALRDGSDVTVAHPGSIKDMKVTKENTLNGTYHSPQTKVVAAADISERSGTSIPFEFVNNFAGNAVNAYVVGLDPQRRVVFVRQDGTLVYPSSGGSGVPVPIRENIKISLPGKGQKLSMTLPISLESGRIYFAEGELQFGMVRTGDGGDGLVQPSVTNLADPSAGTDWGFVELTFTKDGAIYANISYVDFVGMILSMDLTTSDGTPKQVTKGLAAGSMKTICDEIRQQGSKDGRPWGKMCISNGSGAAVRVLSPNDYTVLDSNGFANYWNNYVNQVWDKYSKQSLVINTQGGAGKVSCRVSNNRLNCPGDDLGFDKPSAADIWGCNSGPFANRGNGVHLAGVARLCAAFSRSTLLLPGGDVQPSLPGSSYYTVDPTNHYSRLIHKHEVDGRGYAFSYDDVNPDGSENASGTVASGRPKTLTVYVGGYSA
ncbi:hypothetical protein NLG97_g155 [Lecanicillium saksenae]|uniref:Uncharacterized protein n=1 Tax=Lecanicillium saksenae TaxID=468837 RepID=A0ACC1RAX1_9HYPO|nr:hypothetical protein NLG97_g155 [Lecanicillium saksenae]